MRQLVQPEGIATSTEDADTFTGSAPVEGPGALDLSKGATIGTASAGNISAVKTAKLPRVSTKIELALLIPLMLFRLLR